MALVFRAVLEPASTETDLIATVNEWLGARGIGPLSDSETEVTAGGLRISLRSVEEETARAREVVARHDGTPVRRTTITEIIDDAGPIFLVEEETLDIAGGYSEIPEHSDLLRTVLSISKIHNFHFPSPTPGASTTPIQVWLGQLPYVISVGPSDSKSEVSDLMQERVTGMSFIKREPLDVVAPRVSQPITDGSVVVLDAEGSTRSVLPATVCRLDPLGAARRVHREVLSCIAGHPLPEQLRQAQRQIRRATGSVDEWVNEVDRLEAELQNLRSKFDIAILETTYALSDLDEASRLVKHLERSFREQYLTEAPFEEDESPTISSFDDIFIYAEEQLPNIWIRPETRRDSRTLDQRPEAMAWSMQAWSALLVLNDYAQAKLDGASNGNFLAYCSNAPSGWLALPPNRVAMHESRATLQNPTMRQARTFEVPETVNPNGQLLMEAHIKVVKAGTDVPRLHFYDDTNGETKKVLVGYLGPHLPISSS